MAPFPAATRIYSGPQPTYGDPPAAAPYVDTFDGRPAAPQPYRPDGWDIAVHSRDSNTWAAPSPFPAAFGPDCAPDGTHVVDSYAAAVFHCADRLVAAAQGAGYGALVLTPNRLVDFSGGEAVVSFDVSTTRNSSREWIEIWVTPFEDNLLLPLLPYMPSGSGVPRRAVRIGMGFDATTSFTATVYDEFAEVANLGNGTILETALPGRGDALLHFELRLSSDHIAFGLPAEDVWWVDDPLPPLGWTRGVVQLGMHTFDPQKGCLTGDDCAPTTWQWDNVAIDPALPFTILTPEQRTVDVTTRTELLFPRPAPAGAYLRFAAVGNNIEISFDGGSTWQAAQVQAQDAGALVEEHFRSYWTPVPAGAWYVRFRGEDWSGANWHVRDVAIWGLQVAQ